MVTRSPADRRRESTSSSSSCDGLGTKPGDFTSAASGEAEPGLLSARRYSGPALLLGIEEASASPARASRLWNLLRGHIGVEQALGSTRLRRKLFRRLMHLGPSPQVADSGEAMPVVLGRKL